MGRGRTTLRAALAGTAGRGRHPLVLRGHSQGTGHPLDGVAETPGGVAAGAPGPVPRHDRAAHAPPQAVDRKRTPGLSPGPAAPDDGPAGAGPGHQLLLPQSGDVGGVRHPVHHRLAERSARPLPLHPAHPAQRQHPHLQGHGEPHLRRDLFDDGLRVPRPPGGSPEHLALPPAGARPQGIPEHGRDDADPDPGSLRPVRRRPDHGLCAVRRAGGPGGQHPVDRAPLPSAASRDGPAPGRQRRQQRGHTDASAPVPALPGPGAHDRMVHCHRAALVGRGGVRAGGHRHLSGDHPHSLRVRAGRDPGPVDHPHGHTVLLRHADARAPGGDRDALLRPGVDE